MDVDVFVKLVAKFGWIGVDVIFGTVVADAVFESVEVVSDVVEDGGGGIGNVFGDNEVDAIDYEVHEFLADDVRFGSFDEESDGFDAAFTGVFENAGCDFVGESGVFETAAAV